MLPSSDLRWLSRINTDVYGYYVTCMTTVVWRGAVIWSYCSHRSPPPPKSNFLPFFSILFSPIYCIALSLHHVLSFVPIFPQFLSCVSWLFASSPLLDMFAFSPTYPVSEITPQFRPFVLFLSPFPARLPFWPCSSEISFLVFLFWPPPRLVSHNFHHFLHAISRTLDRVSNLPINHF